MEDYTTIEAYAEAEFIERRSRFIGAVCPVSTEEGALAFVREKKAAHREANHNVYAYLLRNGTVRCSDDGEPQGTAGVPVLDVLRKEGLTDTAVVVTRYFGGILLGAGGLVRAYSHGASCAVGAARRKVMRPCGELTLEANYALYGAISRLLPRYGAVTLDADFGAEVRLRVLLREDGISAFEKELTEITAARVAVRIVERRYACL